MAKFSWPFFCLGDSHHGVRKKAKKVSQLFRKIKYVNIL